MKSKKGISPILATLLLIVIAVAAIIVTYAWVMTFMGAQTSAGGTRLDLEIPPSWNSTAQTTMIVVRNVGTSDARIVRLWIGVNSTSGLVQVTDDTDVGTGKSLPVEQIVTVVLEWPNALAASWTSGRTYYFRVIPEVGAALEFNAKAP